jgi:hypothetical protein
MESWRLVLRQGFFPQWSTETLERTLAVLKADDRRLIQGSTTTPPPLMCVADYPVECCCLVAHCASEDPFNSTVGEVEEGFAKACYNADQMLGEPAACRWLLNWFDDTPRPQVLAELIEEFGQEISNRNAVQPFINELVLQ